MDTITGATVTSDALLLAVAECIQQAGGNPDEWRTEVVKVAGEDIELTADVIVIGAGGAGIGYLFDPLNPQSAVIGIQREEEHSYLELLGNAYIAQKMER